MFQCGLPALSLLAAVMRWGGFLRLHQHREFKDVDRAVYPEIFRMILESGASPNVVGRFGYRLAHHLAATGQYGGDMLLCLRAIELPLRGF